MGKFIYILFIIGWVIYNLYKAVNKNKPATASKPGKSKLDQIRELMEKALQEQNQPHETTIPAPVYETPGSFKKEIIDKDSINKEEVSDKQSEFKSPVYESVENLYFNDDNKIKIEDINPEQETHEHTEKINLKDFNITQAVLYSEILKRPVWLN